MTTIRVRVNPTDSEQYVIYADADDACQPWLAQRPGGEFTGWEYGASVADWPEFELRLPCARVSASTAATVPGRSASPFRTSRSPEEK